MKRELTKQFQCSIIVIDNKEKYYDYSFSSYRWYRTCEHSSCGHNNGLLNDTIVSYYLEQSKDGVKKGITLKKSDFGKLFPIFKFQIYKSGYRLQVIANRDVINLCLSSSICCVPQKQKCKFII